MTDVIEDVQNVLQRAIDILEIVLNHLCQRLNENIHRPLNRRTLVRWIAAFLPNPNHPQLQIQRCLGPALKKYGSGDSLDSYLSLASLNDMIEEDLGDNIIRYRFTGADDDDDSVFDDQTFMCGKVREQLTSTPNFNGSSCSNLASNNTVSDAKMSEMEEELAALRRQIAMLVIAQENSTLSHTLTDAEKVNVSQAASVPLPSSPGEDPSPNDSGCEMNRLPSCTSDDASEQSSTPPPPPPLPPPLPPTPPPPATTIQPCDESPQVVSSSFIPASLSQKNTLSKGAVETRENAQNECRNVPSMSDVLKEMTNVKLRAVDRSPGGTPLRVKPQFDPTDPASIIAQALRKKFAHHRAFFSPESDRENDSSFSSPDYSNQRKQVNQTNTKRRLSLLATSDLPGK